MKMPKERRDVEPSLAKKGFRLREGDHHRFIYFTKTGLKSPVMTMTSHSHRDVSDKLLGKMARDLKLSRAEFDDFVDCALSRDAYESLLVQKGEVEDGPAGGA
ncbi:MAG: hypothetical protein ACRDD1_03175 [Planctomycetia bacterium]